MTNRSKDSSAADDSSQRVIDALGKIEYPALSFAQLRRLSTALLDASKRSAAETGRRADDDVQGDTVRVPVPPALDR